METTNRINTKEMTITALMTAVICILAPLSIQIGIIPISFTNLALYLSVYLIGTRSALTSYFIYYLLGLFGLPVFSGFQGGIGKALGPTGGCLLGFFLMTLISGIFVEKFAHKAIHFIGMVLGTWVLYAMASLWFAVVMHTSIGAGFTACVLPFIGIDMLKMVFAIYLGDAVRKRITKI